ncbi:VOC family protein [Nitrospirillum pindoramense]|uniref:Catechol 2,3-dioxygenase-like lactoylglutathione lyase family enzyme n=1 Tax=Nitrospirillum amazonense TaxID=28077 RepID=A0A560GVP1_9PROT|nr:VOC family protein [Nitrospirillum amazonense]TWB37659.1 catechol 2,3-dioxygenase-like lactoylglutathione lyase family enzyme [Nitrospirillum amazonense]
MTTPRQFIGGVALVVRDYDEAKAWYRDVLGFDAVEDTDLGGGKRWVVMAPPGSPPNSGETRLLLAKAAGPEQEAAIGNQAGGRVFLFLRTDDFWRDYHRMAAAGVTFCEEPRVESYGTVVVFQDLYGTRWDLLQLNV